MSALMCGLDWRPAGIVSLPKPLPPVLDGRHNDIAPLPDDGMHLFGTPKASEPQRAISVIGLGEEGMRTLADTLGSPRPGHAIDAIAAGCAIAFVVILGISAYWDRTIRVLHVFESLPYFVAAVLCLRQ